MKHKKEEIKRFSYFLILLFVFHTGLEMQAQVRGVLLNSDGETYPFVHIFNGKEVVMTNKEGEFQVKATIGDTLIIQQRSYAINNNPFIIKVNNDKAIELTQVIVSDSRWKNADEIKINAEEVKAFRGSSNASIFNGVPGLQVNNIRNEAGALDIGIRGIQGEGRVPIVIDGGIQSTQTFRGYQGSSDRTYIDMDLVKKVTVDKGASFKTNVIGATGGVIEMTTIDAKDIILSGNKFGVYVKGSLVNNNKQPSNIVAVEQQQYYIVQNTINETQFNSGNATLAAGYKGGKVDFLTAIGTHNQGNYFAGEHGATRYGYNPKFYDKRDPEHTDNYKKPEVRPGQEVVNTSYNSIFTLTKLGWNIGKHQRIEANYRYHYQKAGEVLASYWYKNSNDANFKPYADGVESMPQWSVGKAEFNFYGLKYKYNPSKSINLQLSMFANDGNLNQRNGLGQNSGSILGDQYLHEFENKRKGVTVANTTAFDFIPLTLKYGVAAQVEKMIPLNVSEDILGSSRHGKREEYSGFLSSDFKWKKLYFKSEIKAHTAKVTDYTDNSEIDYKVTIDLVGALGYNLSDWLSLYGKASKIYRNPSLFESTKSSQSFSYNNNYPLVPESTNTFEVGFKTRFLNIFTDTDVITFNSGGFINDSKNFISSALVPPDDLFSFINYDRYRLKGIDISLGYQSEYFFLNMSAVLYGDALVCSEILGSSNGNDSCNSQGFEWSVLPNRIPPKQSYTINSGIYAFARKLTLGTRFRYHSVKENPKDWLQGSGAAGVAVRIPADHLIDFYGTYKLNKHLLFSFNIDNLTDRYQYDVGSLLTIPVPGRTIHIGLEANL